LRAGCRSHASSKKNQAFGFLYGYRQKDQPTRCRSGPRLPSLKLSLAWTHRKSPRPNRKASHTAAGSATGSEALLDSCRPDISPNLRMFVRVQVEKDEPARCSSEVSAQAPVNGPLVLDPSKKHPQKPGLVRKAAAALPHQPLHHNSPTPSPTHCEPIKKNRPHALGFFVALLQAHRKTMPLGPMQIGVSAHLQSREFSLASTH